MKTIITILLFLIPCLFALPGTAYGQQGQSGKGFFIEFGNSHNLYKIDPSEAKKRGYIRVRLDRPVDEETSERLKGQSLKFHTGTDGSYYIEILHPDSVDHMTLQDFESISDRKPTGLPVDPEAYLKAFNEQMKDKPLEELPVRIRTQTQSDNRLEVIVENRTGRPLTNLVMEPYKLPDGWATFPEQHRIKVIPPYGSAAFPYTLILPRESGVDRVSFQLQTDNFLVPWSARIVPASKAGEIISDKFELHGNYPNPFNPVTTISYSLPEAMQVSVEVYDVIGRRVAELVNSRQTSGTHNVVWDARSIASGTYIYRITGNGESGSRVLEERAMTLIK